MGIGKSQRDCNQLGDVQKLIAVTLQPPPSHTLGSQRGEWAVGT